MVMTLDEAVIALVDRRSDALEHVIRHALFAGAKFDRLRIASCTANLTRDEVRERVVGLEPNVGEDYRIEETFLWGYVETSLKPRVAVTYWIAP